jgi:hypothetical protein
LEQINVREALVREKEERLERERKHNADVVATFTALRTQHDDERARLKAEHSRLQSMQSDLMVLHRDK